MSGNVVTPTNPKAIVTLPDGSQVVKCKRCSCKNKKVDASTLDPAILEKVKQATKVRPASAPEKAVEKKRAPSPVSAGPKGKGKAKPEDVPRDQGDQKKQLNDVVPWEKKPPKQSSLDDLKPGKPPSSSTGVKYKGKQESKSPSGKVSGKGKGDGSKTSTKGKKGKKGKSKVSIVPPEEPKKPSVQYPPIEKPKKPWVPPDQRPKKTPKKKEVPVPSPGTKTWIPPDQRPKKPKKPPYEAPKPTSSRPWVPPYKRKKSKKEKPKVEIPPFSKRKWIPPYLRPRKKPEPKYKKPDGMSQKLDPSSLKKVWNEYTIFDRYAVLNGHWSQFHKRYGHKSNGFQGPCNVTVAIAMAKLFKMETWDSYLIDKILDLGDLLYLHSMKFVDDAKCDPKIKIDEIFSSFYINNTKITMNMKGDNVTGKLFKDYNEAPDLEEIVKSYFTEHESGILCIQNRHFAIFKQGKGYYMFDPFDHNEEGLPWGGLRGNGEASVIKTLSTKRLVELIVLNVGDGENSKFTITPCSILRQVDVDTEYPSCLDEPEPAEPIIRVPKVVEPKESFDEGFGDDDEEGGAWAEIGEGEMGDDEAAQEIPGEDGGRPPKERKKPLPEDKPRAESITYFLELVPEKLGILRGSTHQEDPNFTKYLGAQSISNAVSAIAMLKIAKSKYWTPHLVNEILKKAEQIHHDTKKLLVGEQELTPGRIVKKVAMDEDHIFSPEIDEISIIGMLQSNKIELLDLLPALQEFYRSRDACIINGPLIVGAWQEDNVYYMYDPNERDKNGMVIIKEIQQGSETKLVDFTPGYACVTWFKDLKDLVSLYMNNCPREKRRDMFVLSNVEINDYVEPFTDWNNFKALSEIKWILRADFSQNNILFTKETRNFQCTANAAMCLIYTKLTPLSEWTTETMNQLLFDGDNYYKACVKNLKDLDKFVDPMLMVDELKKSYKISNRFVKLEIDDCLVNGLINAKDVDEKILNLNKGLKEFFIDNDYAIVTTRNISVAVFKVKGIYYYYDSHSRCSNGYIRSFGTSCILRFLKLDDLVRQLEANLKPGPSNLFNISRVEVQMWDDTDDAAKPPLNHYKELTPYSAILRANISQMHDKFRNNAGKQTIPNLLMALGLSRIYEGSTWNDDWLDRLLDIGDKHYDECMGKYREGKLNVNEEDVLTMGPGEDEGTPPPPPSVAEDKKGRGGGDSLRIKLRGGGEGMKENEEMIEHEISALLSIKTVVGNPNLNHAINSLVKKYPHMIEQSKEKKTQKKKSNQFTDYIDKNIKDVKLRSSLNSSNKDSMSSSFDTLTQLIKNGTMEKRDRDRIVSYIKLCEKNPNAPSIFKSLSGVYPGLFSKTSKMADIIEEQSKDKRVALHPIKAEADVPEASIPTSAETCNSNNIPRVRIPLRQGGMLKVPFYFKARGGMDMLHYDDYDDYDTKPKFGLMQFSTYYDIGPLRKMYKKRKDLDNMLEYRTRLAEVLLRKSILNRTKSRGGGADDFDDLDEFMEENANEDITTDNVLLEFRIGVNRVKCKFETIAEGTFESDFEPTIKAFLEEIVPEDDHREIVIESPLMDIAIWKDNDLFFVYDPRPRDEQGHIYGWDEWTLPPLPYSDEQDYEEADYDEMQAYDELAGGDTMVAKDAEPPPSEHGDSESEEDEEEAEEVEEEEKPTPPTKKGSDYWKGKEKDEGAACILWFANTDALTKYLMENTPPMQRMKPFIMKRVFVVNLPEIKDVFDPELGIKKRWYDGDWYEFKEIDNGRWILRGTINQENELFPDANRGKQTVSNCFVALSYIYMYSIQRFKNKTINDMLKYGDRLYSFTKKLRRKELLDDESLGLRESEVNAVVDAEVYSIKEIYKDFCIGKYERHINVEYEHLTGEINAQEYMKTLDVRRALEEFFQSDTYGILCAKDLCVAIWKGQRMKYMFDPNPRGPDGKKESNGVACITRFYEVNDLANVFLGNLGKDGSNFFAIHRCTLNKNPCPRVPKVEEEKKPDIIAITGYQCPVPGKYILRGTLSADDAVVFGRGCNQFPETIAVVALAMSLIHRSANWSRPIIDEILHHGDNLYAATLDNLGFDFNPWEEKLSLDMIPADFNIGHIKINICVRNNDQKGIIAIKNPNVPNLRMGLERFFEENTHGVIETEYLTVAVWEDDIDHFIYMYDPNPRSATGMPQPIEGTACALCFESFKIAADHFASLIPNEEKRQGEYIITPIEIIVGKRKPKHKKKRRLPRNMCTEEILAKKRREEEARRRREAERCAKIGRNEFYQIPPGEISILRGTRSQASKYYSKNTRDLQDIPICLMAFLMDRLLPVKQWNWRTINTIVDVGDQLYKDSYIMYNPKDKKLGLEYVIRKIIIRDILVQIQICKPVMVNQLILPNLTEVLEVALSRKPIWLLCAGDKWLLVFQRDGLFYAFDSHDLDLRGNYTEKCGGFAAVLQFQNIKSMADKLFANLFRGEDDLFFVCALGIKNFEKIAKCEC